MAVMGIMREHRGHVRPLDPGRDLAEVANLLEAAFAGQMDESGRLMLQELRGYARLGPWLGRWLGIPLGFGTAIVAFVWEEEGRIVGHAMAMRMDVTGSRWQIANVAVDADFRGRGIGRALMETILDYLRQQQAQWALLQVRVGNLPALHLYRSLGFETVCGEIHWEGPVPPSSSLSFSSPLSLKPIRFTQMNAWHRLAHRSLTRGGQWWWSGLQLSRERQSPGTWLRTLLRIRRVERWGYWNEGRLVAAVGLVIDRWTGVGRFSIRVDRERWGTWEPSLVAWSQARAWRAALSSLRGTTELDDTPLSRALVAAGFRARHRLFNMRCPL